MAPQEIQEELSSEVDREIQLRREIALLEAEAIAKKQAADVALRNAMDALNEVAGGDVEEEGGKENAAATVAINGTIDAVSKLMKEVEEEEAPPSSSSSSSTPGGDEETSPEGREEEHYNDDDLLVATSDFGTVDDGFGLGSPRSSHVNTMEDTLDTLMSKIQECTAIITDPDATMQEQLDAAQLVSQYAKTAKAFQNAI